MNLRLVVLTAAVPSFLHAISVPIRRDFCEQIHGRSPDAEAFFIGTVISETPLRFRVDESFLGFAEGATQEFVWQADRACARVTFGRGRQYLVRASVDAGNWTIASCTHSAEVSEQVAMDIRGLRAWKRGERFLHGGVVDTTRRPGLPPGQSADAADLPIRLTSDNGVDRLVRTGPHGLFQFDGLPPGRYKLHFAEPGWAGGFHNDKLTQAIDLTAQACAATYFAVVENPSTIRGHLAGASVAGLIVEAEPILSPGQVLYTRNRRATTNPDGTFTIEKVPAGNYRLVLNPDGRLDTTSPYPRSESARTVRAARGEPIEIGEWPLPPPLEARPVRGTVRWKKSAPHPPAPTGASPCPACWGWTTN